VNQQLNSTQDSRPLNGALIEDALATREGQGWSAPSHDLSASVVSRIRASHGRKPLTEREPADRFVLKARLMPLPMLAGGALAAAAVLAFAAFVQVAYSPAGPGLGRQLTHGLTMRAPLVDASPTHAARTMDDVASNAAAPGSSLGRVSAPLARNEPFAEEVRRLGDDTRRAADAVLSTLQVGAKEPAPR